MKTESIRRATIKGLVQWDKGQVITLDTATLGIQDNYYIVQERDDGTMLQYKLETPTMTTGSLPFTIPDDMLEEANTLVLYGQDGDSASKEMQCISIVTLPITEREKPEDLPVPVKVDTKMLFNAIGEVLDQSGVNIGAYGLTFGNNSISQGLTSLKIEIKEDATDVPEITYLNQPLLHFDSYNYNLLITYGEELEGKLQATCTTTDGKSYTIDITNENSSKSAISGFTDNTYNTAKILGAYNANPVKMTEYPKYFGNSKICGTFNKYATDSYPYLACNMK